MNDNHLYSVLANALGTIEMQRQEIAQLRPAADGYARLSQLLDLAHGRGGAERAYGVDVSWEIKSAMEEIHAGMVASKMQADKDPHAPMREAFAQRRQRDPGEPHDAERREATQDFGEERDDIRTTLGSTAAVDLSGRGFAPAEHYQGDKAEDPDNPDQRPAIEREIDRAEAAPDYSANRYPIPDNGETGIGYDH